MKGREGEGGWEKRKERGREARKATREEEADVREKNEMHQRCIRVAREARVRVKHLNHSFIRKITLPHFYP